MFRLRATGMSTARLSPPAATTALAQGTRASLLAGVGGVLASPSSPVLQLSLARPGVVLVYLNFDLTLLIYLFSKCAHGS